MQNVADDNRDCLAGLGLMDLYTQVRFDLQEPDKAKGIRQASERIRSQVKIITATLKQPSVPDNIVETYSTPFQSFEQNLDWAYADIRNYDHKNEWWKQADNQPWKAKAVDSVRWSSDFWKLSNGKLELCKTQACDIDDTTDDITEVKPTTLARNIGCLNEVAAETKAYCENAYRLSASLRSLAFMIHETVNTQLNDQRNAVEQLYQKQSEAWNTYVEQQPILWSWEAVANRALRTWLPCKAYRFGKEEETVQCYPVDNEGNPIGRAPMPSVRYFFLHPEPTITYLPGADDGDQAKVGLAMQWFGAMHTRVKGDKLENPIGLSLVSVISDNPSIDDVGHGAMLNWGNMGLAITDHGGEMVYSLNLDLLSMIKDKSSDKYINQFIKFTDQ